MRKKLFIFILIISLAHTAFATEYIEKWEDLPKYGLMFPDATDIESAKRIIVMTIQATTLKKGNWWKAQGLLGATRIPSTPEAALYSRLGYISLFDFGLVSDMDTKMEANATFGEGLLLYKLEKSCKSWIYQREHYIGTIGKLMYNRFTYNEVGNYGEVPLSPTPNHKSSVELKGKVIINAYTFYNELRTKGFDDKTLGDAIGVATALLEYDGLRLDKFFILPFTAQVYSDTVAEIIKEIKRGSPFYNALAEAMWKRGLQTADIIALPENQQQMDTLVKLIKEDLDYIEKISKKAITEEKSLKKK